MKPTRSKISNLFIISVALLFSLVLLPTQSYAQWEDRSDELMDTLDTRDDSTMWIVLGSGLALATTAIIIHRSNKKEKAQQEQQAVEEEPTSTKKISVTPFMGFQQNPMEIRSDHKSLSDNLVLGVSVRF